MNKNDYIIRNERKEEQREVEFLVRESFWNVYRPGCLEHYVLNQLRDDADFIPELNFVMEKDGRIIGQNMFMKAKIKADDGRDIPILTMGPICIANELKRQGYGKILLDYSLKKGYLDGVAGEYSPPQGYFVNEAEAEDFDKQFPPKEKLKLPTQLF